jgi:hypothetical protein
MPELTMTLTLKEITDLLGVNHSKALKKVLKMAEDPEFGEVAILASSYINNLGVDVPFNTCRLTKRQSIAVAARLNVASLMRVVDRCFALEEQYQQLAAHALRELPEAHRAHLATLKDYIELQYSVTPRCIPDWDKRNQILAAPKQAVLARLIELRRELANMIVEADFEGDYRPSGY